MRQEIRAAGAFQDEQGFIGSKWDFIEDLTPIGELSDCDDIRCESKMSYWESPDGESDELCLTCTTRAEVDDDYELEYDVIDAVMVFVRGAMENGCIIYPRPSGHGIDGSHIYYDCKETGFIEVENIIRICTCDVGDFILKFEENQRKWRVKLRENS